MFDEKKVRWDLLHQPEPTLLIVGEIEGNEYSKVQDSLLHLRSCGSPRLKIHLDSNGGEVDAGLAIYDALRMYEGETECIVQRGAGSIAAVVLQACKIRTCLRHARVLIHHVSRTSVKYDELRSKTANKRLVERLDFTQKRIYTVLAQRTKQPIALIRKTCRRDEWMTSEEALNFGLIDKII